MDLLPLGISEVEVLGGEDQRVGLSPQRPVTLACGSGPSLLVDGVSRVSTSVTTTVGDLVAGRPAKAVPCSGSDLLLSPGQHRVTVEATPALLVDAVTLSGRLPAQAAAAEVPQVTAWEPTHREVVIAPSSSTRTLELSENANRGWTASVDGRALEPLRVDGWRQAFVVPAGVSGTVVVEFEPDRYYRAALLVGAVLLVVVLALALWPARTRTLPGVGPRRGRALVAAAVVLAVAAVAGPVGLVVGAVAGGAVLALWRRGRDAAWMLALACAGTAGLIQVAQVSQVASPEWGWLSTVSALLAVAGVSATGARAVAGEPRAASS